jgi:hypothetical protein
MAFLNEKVFEPILNSKTCSPTIKIGIKLTIGKMNRLNAEKMIQYFLELTSENAVVFTKFMKDQKLTPFDDIVEEFRNKFNDNWLRK